MTRTWISSLQCDSVKMPGRLVLSLPKEVDNFRKEKGFEEKQTNKQTNKQTRLNCRKLGTSRKADAISGYR